MSYARFPPWKGHVLVPTASREETLAGLSLYTPSRRRGLLLKSVAEGLVQAFGPRMLPGRRAERTPVPIAEWDEIEDVLHREVGPFDSVAVHTRRLPHRPGVAVLLLRGGRPVAFAKAGPDAAIENEQRALRLMDSQGWPTVFQAPHSLGMYTVGASRVGLMTLLPQHRHRPLAHPQLTVIIQDVQHALQHLPRPEEVPLHWTPMHGDLSPWNLRIDSRNQVILFDWEEAGFGPPGADEVYYAIASAVLRRAHPLQPGPSGEALSFWESRLEARPPHPLRASMLRELSKLRQLRPFA